MCREKRQDVDACSKKNNRHSLRWYRQRCSIEGSREQYRKRLKIVPEKTVGGLIVRCKKNKGSMQNHESRKREKKIGHR